MSYTDAIRNSGDPPKNWEKYNYVIEIPSYDHETIQDLESIGWEEFSKEVTLIDDCNLECKSVWLGKSKT